MTATRGLKKNNGLIASEVRAIAIDASNTLFAGTYGIGMFRSTDDGQEWEKVNNGLSALYESCLAINADGDIFSRSGFCKWRRRGVSVHRYWSDLA